MVADIVSLADSIMSNTMHPLQENSSLQVTEGAGGAISPPTTAKRTGLLAKITNTAGKAASTLQRFNLAKLIDDMEKDEHLANQLESVNREIDEENARKELVREAIELCHAEIQRHLDDFIQESPDATYEDWIQAVHPENVHQGTLLEELSHVDFRFYVEDSDHRLLWNTRVPESRQVAARSNKQQEVTQHARQAIVDLLE